MADTERSLIRDDKGSVRDRRPAPVDTREDLEALLAEIAGTSRQPVLVLELDLTVCYANPACLKLFRTSAAATVGRSMFSVDGCDRDIPGLRDRLEGVAAGGTELTDYRVELAGGDHDGPCILLLNARRLGGRGRITDRLLLCLEDVTERERLQADLAGRIDFDEMLIDSLRESVLVLGADLRVQRANRPFFELFRVSPEQTLGRHLYELGNGQWNIPALRQLLGETLSRQHSLDDYRVEHAFETIGWRRMSLNARRLDHLDLILLTIHDLTDSERRRSRLGESERRLRLAAGAARLGLFEWDVASDTAQWENPCMYEIFGRTPAQGSLSRATFLDDVIEPQDREEVEAAMTRALQSGETLHVTCRIRRGNDSERRWIAIFGDFDLNADGTARRMVGVVSDITDYKRVEQRLRASEQRWRSLLAFLPVAVYTCDAEGRITYFNRRAVELWGRAPRNDQDDVRFCGSFRLFHPDGRALPHDQTPMAEAVRHGHRFYDMEVVMEQANGRQVHALVNIEPLYEDGLLMGAINCFVDITERRQAEASLRELTASLEEMVIERTAQLEQERNFVDTVLDNQPTPVLVVDEAGRMVRYNRACETTTGRDFAQLRGTTAWMQLVPDEEQEALVQLIEKLRSAQAPLVHVNRWCHLDGTERLFLWNNSVVRDATGKIKYIIGSGVDITEQRAAEQQERRHLEELARLQRLQSANELASLLAHELNQPLGVIAMLADTSRQLLAQTSPAGTALKQNLQEISNEALRGGEIIRRLREFVSKGELELEPVDVNSVVGNACQLIRSRAAACGVQLEHDLAGTLPTVSGVYIHLEQVLFNLLNNAIEAIQDVGMHSGRIVVETRCSNGRVRVTVRDNGPGIDPALLNKGLFDTLASTKEYGLGVGLRLSRSLIEAHDGRLWLEPDGPGATFHFELAAAP